MICFYDCFIIVRKTTKHETHMTAVFANTAIVANTRKERTTCTVT